MSQLVVFIAGLLLVAESQASDLADRSSLQGFLPKHDKFITPNFNSAKPQMQDLQKIADREDKQALQKLPATGSNDPISLSIFGIGLVCNDAWAYSEEGVAASHHPYQQRRTWT